MVGAKMIPGEEGYITSTSVGNSPISNPDGSRRHGVRARVKDVKALGRQTSRLRFDRLMEEEHEHFQISPLIRDDITTSGNDGRSSFRSNASDSGEIR